MIKKVISFFSPCVFVVWHKYKDDVLLMRVFWDEDDAKEYKDELVFIYGKESIFSEKRLIWA